MAEKKSKSRFVDQKGQWKSTTPASVKKRQARELDKLAEMLKNSKSGGKKKK